MKKVAVIVVTYNRLELLKEVIASLRIQSYTDRDIIVVDNSSTDGTNVWLKQQNDLIVITQKNLGGAGGFYTGIKYACENAYSYVWLMDDDVVCGREALSELVKSITLFDNIGFVCSRVMSVDGFPMNVPRVYDRPSKNGYIDAFDYIYPDGMLRVSFATFVSILIPTRVVYELGLPIKEYFIWGDDSEYTERISLKYPCYLACKSLVIHKRSLQTSLDFAHEKNPLRLRNYYYFFRNALFTSIKNRNYLRLMKLTAYDTFLLIKFLLLFKWKHFAILLQSMSSLFVFHPKIMYPEKI